MRHSLFVLLLAGCASGPKYKIDDNVLAQVAIEEKQGILTAQHEQNVAKEEMRKAEADLVQCDRELDLANNEYKQTKMQIENAEIQQKANSYDLNKKSVADRELEIAKLAKKTADAKVSFYEKKRKWLKAIHEAGEAKLVSAEATTELEKARLVQSKGMKPYEGFSVTVFESENFDKQGKLSSARADADKRKADADQAESEWRRLDGEYQSARNATPKAQ